MDKDFLFERLSPYLPSHMANYLGDEIDFVNTKSIFDHIRSLRTVLSTYLPRYLVEQIVKDPRPGRVTGGFQQGTAMFADVSGFTAMSERLSVLGKEGAEEITGIVSDYFEAMIGISAKQGGDLLKFGGDALLVFFEGERGPERALVTANAMQNAMSDFDQVKTSQGVFPLRMSIGMGSGPVFLTNLGTAEGMEYAVMGRALANMAKAEDKASAGQIMVDRTTCEAARATASFIAYDNEYWLLDKLLTADPLDLQLVQEVKYTPLENETPGVVILDQCNTHLDVIDGLVPYIPTDFLNKLIFDPQQPILQGSHRPVTVMFANYYGIDKIIEVLGPKHTQKITMILDNYLVTMSHIITRYGGTISRLDAYVIGHRIMARYGALRAHEDDPQRAIHAALEMNQAMEDVNRRTCEILSTIPEMEGVFGLTPLKQRVGINSGFVFASNVGSSSRREYTVMGDDVNLTARLMSLSKEGEVLIGESTALRVDETFELEEKDAVRVKGKSKPVRSFVVKGLQKRLQRWEKLTSSPIVGRDEEIILGQKAVKRALGGKGSILAIKGVSGIGKTRLAEEIAYFGETLGMDLLVGNCLSYGKTMTYHPWTEILRSYFSIQMIDESQSPRARIEAVESGMASIGEGDWAPVIGGVLGLEIGENDLTRGLDAKLRRQRVLDLTVKLLQIKAQDSPLMVVVEDTHWADPASIDLINYVARNIADHPILFMLPYRPDDGLPDWTDYSHAIDITLGDLVGDICIDIVRSMLGSIEFPDSMCEIIQSKGSGNPFFIGEVVRALIDAGAIQEDENGTWKAILDLSEVELPDTIHGIIISRIDRLLASDRRILQIASVVGRVFAFHTLTGIDAFIDLDEVIRARLNYLEGLGLTELQTMALEVYRFIHLTTHEVVYESLSFDQRRDLHRRIGDFIEGAFSEALGEQTDLLAYHYFQGQAWEKSLGYNLLAAQHAQNEFANDTAIAAYQSALEAANKLESVKDTRHEQISSHESLGDVFTLIGQYDQALEEYASARELVTDLDTSIIQLRHTADLCRKTADVVERRSEYDLAFEWLDRGLDHLSEGEPSIEMARIYLLGTGICRRQGKNDEAINWCEKSLTIASQITTREGRQAEAQADYNLGGIHYRRGDLQRAIEYCQESLHVYTQIDDIFGQSQAYLNLASVYSDQGDWKSASDAYQKSLAIKKQVGDVLHEGFISNNLGNIYIYRGDYSQAAHLFGQSISIWKQLGAALPEAVTKSNLAQVHIYQQNWREASECLSRSEEIFNEIGSEDFLAELERRWGEFYLRTGEFDKALNHTRRSLELSVIHETRLEEGMTLRIMGEVLQARGEPDNAEIALRTSLQILEGLKSEYEAAKTLLSLTKLSKIKRDDVDRAQLAQIIQTFEKLGAQVDLEDALNLVDHQSKIC